MADPLLQSSIFSSSSEDFDKFEVFPQTGEGEFNTNKTLLKGENYAQLNSPHLK